MPAITTDMFDEEAVPPIPGIDRRLVSYDDRFGVGISVIGPDLTLFSAGDDAGISVQLSVRITPEALRYVADWMEAQS